MSVWAYVHTSVWRSENNLKELVVSFYHVDLGDELGSSGLAAEYPFPTHAYPFPA